MLYLHNILLHILGLFLALTTSPGNPGRPLSPCDVVHTRMKTPSLESRDFQGEAPQAIR